MPEISLFYGIRVTMYYDDHNPPHFHAEYNGNKAIIEIDTARCIKGALPSRQLKLILAWCVLHQDELMQNWELSKDSVFVYFEDGKIVCYDMKNMLDKEVFKPLKDISIFVDACTVMNDTLAWDIGGNRDAGRCIDIDPDTLYELPYCEEHIA